MRNIELSMSVHFFQLIVFVNENVENRTLFVTQFVFYLMVLFVRCANEGKVNHGKTNRVFYILSGLLHHSGSSWSYVKDLYLVITRGKEQRIFHRLVYPMYNTGSRTIVFGFCSSRVCSSFPLQYICSNKIVDRYSLLRLCNFPSTIK